MANAPTLTATTGVAPSPWVTVSFPTVASGTQTINISRVVEGRTYKVRGGQGLFAVGGVALADYEAAIGSPNTYRAEQFNSSGVSLGFTDSASITISAAAAISLVQGAWISQPLKPLLAIQVQLLMGTAAKLVRSSPGAVYYPEGATVGTQIGGQRQGLAGTPISILCQSGADADTFQQMIGSYIADFPAVLCIRTAPPIRLPRVLFASCPQPEEVALGPNATNISFNLTIDEVQAPAPGLIIPLLRREDIDAAFTTRTARAAAYATRLARDTDFTKAGLAGP